MKMRFKIFFPFPNFSTTGLLAFRHQPVSSTMHSPLLFCETLFRFLLLLLLVITKVGDDISEFLFFFLFNLSSKVLRKKLDDSMSFLNGKMYNKTINPTISY
eukprot:TRINITY_DN2454_c0_g2_i1.p1 TRINITY_DN2454_c0_g2~~TRINITY_DN2454_c0_g2_i1.p1  ORF type:complete len:102 (-),score=2.82 TRINITY_DN2454_c0_g2_i1:753-1058(-)